MELSACAECFLSASFSSSSTASSFIFLHLHEIVEGLYFYFSLSVCLSVCVYVCVFGTSDLDASFAKWLLNTTLARTY